MNDLDPNYFLPLWQAVIAYFRRYRPLVQAEQYLVPRHNRHAGCP
jgi:hypothetical protein